MINYHHPKRPINYVHPGRSNTPAQGATIVLQKGQSVILRSSGAVRA